MLCDDQEGWDGVGLGGRSKREEIRVCVCVCEYISDLLGCTAET